jgi:hypothetical protein
MPRDNGRPLAVYICLRQYDPALGLTVHLKGMGLRVYHWTPAEVQRIIHRAFVDAQQQALHSTTKGPHDNTEDRRADTDRSAGGSIDEDRAAGRDRKGRRQRAG